MAVIKYQQPMITYVDAEIDTDKTIDELVRDKEIDVDEERAARAVTITKIDACDNDRDVAIHYLSPMGEECIAWVHSDDETAEYYFKGVQFERDDDAPDLARFFQEIGLNVGI